MSDDYEVVTTSPLHLELMLQAPNQGATASQDDQGCEIETSLTSSMIWSLLATWELKTGANF